VIGKKSIVTMVARHWPFANGAGRFIDKFANNIELGTGQRQCRASDGFDIDVFADDHIGRHLILSGAFDPSPIKILTDFAMKGDRCLDIGANIGYVSCLMLSRIQESHVFCVEPQPGIVSLLEINLKRFPPDRWNILQAALSDAEGEGHLELDTVNRGASTIVTTASQKTVSVPLLPAAQVLSGFKSIDLIKIDIEGHEETVFRSARDEIERLQPRVILYEDKERKSAPDGSIAKILVNLGYQIYGIKKSILNTKIISVDFNNCGTFNDFIAISSQRELPKYAIEKYLNKD
jgi:FkbM family methyltransferase